MNTDAATTSWSIATAIRRLRRLRLRSSRRGSAGARPATPPLRRSRSKVGSASATPARTAALPIDSCGLDGVERRRGIAALAVRHDHLPMLGGLLKRHPADHEQRPCPEHAQLCSSRAAQAAAASRRR